MTDGGWTEEEGLVTGLGTLVGTSTPSRGYLTYLLDLSDYSLTYRGTDKVDAYQNTLLLFEVPIVLLQD